MAAIEINRMKVEIKNVQMIQKGDLVTEDFYGDISNYKVVMADETSLSMSGDTHMGMSKGKLAEMIKSGKIKVEREIIKPKTLPWNKLADVWQPDGVFVETIDSEGYKQIAKKGYNDCNWVNDRGAVVYYRIISWREIEK